MKHSTLTYFRHRPLRLLQDAFWGFVMVKFLRKEIANTPFGIRIASDDRCSNITETEFADCASEALRTLQQFDPFRFKLVKNHVRVIVQDFLLRLAQYYPLGQECHIDMDRLNRESKRHGIPTEVYCACIIVHEACHGYLLARGVKHGRAQRPRIERICNRQAFLFLTKSLGRKDDWVKMFDQPVPALPRLSLVQRLKLAMRLYQERTRG